MFKEEFIMKKILGMALVMIFMLAVCVACAVPEEEPNSGNSPAPLNSGAVNSETVKSGGDISAEGGELSDLKFVSIDGEELEDVYKDANLTVINVWATWCTPCVKELPEIQKLADEYKAAGVNIFGVLFDSEEDGAISYAKELLDEKGVKYTQIRATDDMLMFLEKHDVTALPTTFFVDPDGNITDTEISAHTYEEWKEIIDRKIG